jgi:hypothetical protein
LEPRKESKKLTEKALALIDEIEQHLDSGLESFNDAQGIAILWNLLSTIEHKMASTMHKNLGIPIHIASDLTVALRAKHPGACMSCIDSSIKSYEKGAAHAEGNKS